MIETLAIPVLPSFEALDAHAVAGLDQAPALIIEQPYAGFKIPSLALATRRVGNKLAHLLGAQYTHEGGASVGSGIQSHVDGLVPQFWQVNTSKQFGEYHKFEDSVDGTKFTLQELASEESVTEDLLLSLRGGERPVKPYNSTFYLNKIKDNQGRIRPGLNEELVSRGCSALTETRRFVGFVPLGGTIIFVNGTGVDPHRICMHSTSSAVRFGDTLTDTMRFSRRIVLGRVTVN